MRPSFVIVEDKRVVIRCVCFCAAVSQLRVQVYMKLNRVSTCALFFASRTPSFVLSARIGQPLAWVAKLAVVRWKLREHLSKSVS